MFFRMEEQGRGYDTAHFFAIAVQWKLLVSARTYIRNSPLLALPLPRLGRKIRRRPGVRSFLRFDVAPLRLREREKGPLFGRRSQSL